MAAKLLIIVADAVGRAAGGFRRGIDSGRCDLARVKRDAGRCAEPMGKDAKQDRHYHREPNRCFTWQMHFLLQINQPLNKAAAPRPRRFVGTILRSILCCARDPAVIRPKGPLHRRQAHRNRAARWWKTSSETTRFCC